MKQKTKTINKLKLTPCFLLIEREQGLFRNVWQQIKWVSKYKKGFYLLKVQADILIKERRAILNKIHDLEEEIKVHKCQHRICYKHRNEVHELHTKVYRGL